VPSRTQRSGPTPAERAICDDPDREMASVVVPGRRGRRQTRSRDLRTRRPAGLPERPQSLQVLVGDGAPLTPGSAEGRELTGDLTDSQAEYQSAAAELVSAGE
jgi:hypothetical protein